MNDHVQRQLVSSLARLQSAGENHPDAETLNAFRERGLSLQSRQGVAEHLAGCAGCREVLSLSELALRAGQPPQRPVSRALPLSLAAAAALVVVFAATTSRLDDGVVDPAPLMRSNLAAYSSGIKPVLAYTFADLAFVKPPVRWRVRDTGVTKALEMSHDAGRSWQPAKLNWPLEPQKVWFQGTDVWVTGRSGDVLLSRDSGQHWTYRMPEKPRSAVQTR